LSPPPYLFGVSPAYLQTKLTRPLPTKDGGTLRTVLDARTHMLALSQIGNTTSNGNALANCYSADVEAFRRQVELALFYDAKLVLT
jgi:hypothetical protein